jgi:hypothetical protein
MIVRPRPSWGRFFTPLVPRRGIGHATGDEFILSKSGFKGIVDQTRGDDSKCLEFRKIIAFFENPLLLFRLKVKSSKAPSLVSQPWVDVSSRLISLLSL